MGRPSKYKKEFCQDLIDHMADGFSIESFPGTLYEKYKLIVCRDSIYEWATKHTEFSDSKKSGEALQLKFYEKSANEAFDKGKTGFPTSAWIFTMKNKFKWRDDPHNDQASDDRPTLSDIMKSVSNESHDTKKKKRSSAKSKK